MNEHKLKKTSPKILRNFLSNLLGTFVIAVISYFLNSFNWLFVIFWFIAWNVIDFFRFKYWKL